MVSIVSTYRNRRHHIAQTLPTWLAQNNRDYEIIIVDYRTDDDIGDLASTMSPSVPIFCVRYEGSDLFRLSHARNIGARFASGDWLLFVDIDTKLNPGIVQSLSDKAIRGKYFAAQDSAVRKEIINGGLIFVSKESHGEACGFNENMNGWGFEDIDYKRRLEANGDIWESIGSDLYECIDHPDHDRIGFYSDAKEISWTKNRQIALQGWRTKRYGMYSKVEVRMYFEPMENNRELP